MLPKDKGCVSNKALRVKQRGVSQEEVKESVI